MHAATLKQGHYVHDKGLVAAESIHQQTFWVMRTHTHTHTHTHVHTHIHRPRYSGKHANILDSLFLDLFIRNCCLTALLMLSELLLNLLGRSLGGQEVVALLRLLHTAQQLLQQIYTVT